VTANRLPIDAETLRTWLVSYISSVLDLPAEGFPTAARFDSFGLDSVEAVVMAGVLEEEFRVPVDPIQFFENPSVDAFVAAYASDGTGSASAPAGDGSPEPAA
jgi:acyl carrier protein